MPGHCHMDEIKVNIDIIDRWQSLESGLSAGGHRVA